MKISVVIAIFNEKENIIELTQRLVAVLSALKIDYEMVYVIQGTDGTLGLVQDYVEKHKIPIRIIYSKDPLGVGVALRTGFCNISEDSTHVLTLDADLNHQPEDLPHFFKELEIDNVDIVIGSRYIPGGIMLNVHRWRYVLSKFVNLLFSYLVDLKINDKTSGYRLQKREVVVSLRDVVVTKNFDFYIDYLVMAQKAGFAMVEIPITFIARTKGTSKMKIVGTFMRYLMLVIRNSRSKVFD